MKVLCNIYAVKLKDAPLYVISLFDLSAFSIPALYVGFVIVTRMSFEVFFLGSLLARTFRACHVWLHAFFTLVVILQ